jgi:hypothetical protein
VNDARDDELIEELRGLFRRTDPIPPEATEFSRAALGWRRLDADLAELLADSALASGAALTRAGEPAERSLTFGGSELTIEVTVASEGSVHTLLGQLAPAEQAGVEVQAEDGSLAASTESDALGRFRATFEGGGRFRVRVRRAEAVEVETSWFSV